MAGTAGTHEHRARPGALVPAQPPDLSGSVPPESGYVLGAAADRSGEPTPRRDRHRRPSERFVPTCDAAPWLISTNRRTGTMFSLDYRNLIRVRLPAHAAGCGAWRSAAGRADP